MRSRLALLLVAVLLVGCATPPPPRAPGAAAAWLGGSPRVVVRFDARAVQAWGQVTRNRDSLRSVGERTAVVWAGMELNSLDDLSRAADSVRIVLEGDYPQFGAGLMLDWNGAWKKNPAEKTWTNQALGFSVSLPEEGLVAVRRHDARAAQPSPGVLRGLDPRALESVALWLSFWNPGEALFGTVGARLLPVERLDVALTAREGTLEGPIVLQFSDGRAALAATVMLKLLSSQVRSRLGQDLEWSAEDNRVVGRTLRLKQEDIRALAEKLLADPQEGTP